MENYLKDALCINELNVSLENISYDDNREISSYTQEEIVNEAKYVLSTFFEGGHMNNDELHDKGSAVRNGALKQVRDLKKLIKKYK